ncbi:LysR family transcriptional regulator [Sphingomonas nostoxanthinifaciens]|nr:LysR family transcriptional regulator [Sphingomonas nostoxanthinifaciens]
MLQDQLFIRERYGLQSTAVAVELAPGIAEALAKLDDSILGQQEFDPRKAERTLTIAPNGYVEFVLVPALVAKLQEEAPGIRLRLTPYGNDLVDTGVVSGSTALVLGRIVDPPDNLVVQHLMGEGLAFIVRADHPDIGDHLTREQFEGMKHVNIVPPGRMRAGLFHALAQQQVKRDVAISATNFFAVAEVVAVTDYCATLPKFICWQLLHDTRVKVVPAPVDLGSFPVDMAWHVRYRHDAAHRWLRSFIMDVTAQLTECGHAF